MDEGAPGTPREALIQRIKFAQSDAALAGLKTDLEAFKAPAPPTFPPLLRSYLPRKEECRAAGGPHGAARGRRHGPIDCAHAAGSQGLGDVVGTEPGARGQRRK